MIITIVIIPRAVAVSRVLLTRDGMVVPVQICIVKIFLVLLVLIRRVKLSVRRTNRAGELSFISEMGSDIKSES